MGGLEIYSGFTENMAGFFMSAANGFLMGSVGRRIWSCNWYSDREYLKDFCVCFQLWVAEARENLWSRATSTDARPASVCRIFRRERMKQGFTAGQAVGHPASPARVLRAACHLNAGHGLFSVSEAPQSQPGHAIEWGGLYIHIEETGSTHQTDKK